MKTADKLAAKSAVKTRASEDSLEFFRDPYDSAYATIPVGTHRETWPIVSRRFWLWVARTLTEHLKAPPPKSLVNEIVAEFEMWALCDGEVHEVSIRLAEHRGATYLDLANEDWESVKINDDEGWRIVSEQPVKFLRKLGLAELPHPVGGGDPREIVRFLNVQPHSEILILSWLSYAFRSRGPFPILALSGVQGCGKSTVTKVLRALVDPSHAELSDVPRDERSLVMSASNSHLLTFDNLSEIRPAMSDMFCRVATGGAHRERKYYTNDGSEVLFTFQNPMIVNGIAELPERADLLDRSLVVHMKAITEDHRRDERTFWQEFAEARPRLFGALLDVVCAGQRRIRTVTVPHLPRMADFARWGVAVEQSFGYKRGTFLDAYRLNLADANAAALEASPVAWTIHEFLLEQPGKYYRSSSRALLSALDDFLEIRKGNGKSLVRKDPKWPRTPGALSAEIARVAPNLKKVGVRVERGRQKAARWIEMTMNERDTEEPLTDQSDTTQWVATG